MYFKPVLAVAIVIIIICVLYFGVCGRGNYCSSYILQFIPLDYELPALPDSCEPAGGKFSLPEDSVCGTVPSILPRVGWRARKGESETLPPLCPNGFALHHTAMEIEPSRSIGQTMRIMQDSHIDGRGWEDIAYHFFIDANGDIAEGRRLSRKGNINTVPDRDVDISGLINISLEGDFTRVDPTPEQMESLNHLVCWLSNTYRIPASRIYGHNDYYSGTECPGRLEGMLPGIRESVEEMLEQPEQGHYTGTSADEAD